MEDAGKDASRSFDDVGHSSDARAILVKYKIGEIVEVTTSNTPFNCLHEDILKYGLEERHTMSLWVNGENMEHLLLVCVGKIGPG